MPVPFLVAWRFSRRHPAGAVGRSTSGRLKFEIDRELEPGLITSRAGLPGLFEAYRLSGTARVIFEFDSAKADAVLPALDRCAALMREVG